MPKPEARNKFKVKFVRQIREEPDCHKMTMDILSPLEALWLALIHSGIMILMMAAMLFLRGVYGDGSWTYYFLKAGLVEILIGLLLYNMCNEYYLLDFSRQALIFHSEKFGSVKESVAAQPFEMKAVTVDGFLSKNGNWLYRIILVLGDKEVIPLSDFDQKSYDFEKLNDKAKKIAKNFNLDFMPSPGKKFPSLHLNENGKISIEFVDSRFLPPGNSVNFIFVFFLLFFTASVIFLGHIDFDYIFGN